MNKEEYLEKIKTMTGISKKDINNVLEAYLELIKAELIANQRLNITNFGTFHIKKTKPHEFFSPVDGKKIKTLGINKVFFISSKDLLHRISGV